MVKVKVQHIPSGQRSVIVLSEDSNLEDIIASISDATGSIDWNCRHELAVLEDGEPIFILIPT